MAHGFLGHCCSECGRDEFLASSCKRRGSCPACVAQRMSQTAAHPVDHVTRAHRYAGVCVLSLPIALHL